MESVGKKLRDARLRKQLTLEDISAATKINLRNLEAIETDDLEPICSPFTYRSFARQFANFVQVDWAELDAALSEMSSRIPTPLVPGEAGAPLPVATNRKQNGRLTWVLSFASFALMLGLCSALYSAWQNSRIDLRSSISGFTGSFVSHTENKPLQSAPAKSESHVQPTAPSPISGTVAPKTFRIELSALEECWLSVAADGKEVFAGVLEPSQTKVLDGQEEARIRTGNAGGVTVNFNGRSLGTLGRRGEVRTVVFNKDGYEVLTHAARLSLITAAGE